MKKHICIITSVFVASMIAAFAQTGPDNEAYLQGIKEQLSLPPQIAAFISFKEQQNSKGHRAEQRL